jgi:hypothetical protein
MHARVFDSIIQTTFAATALKALVGIAALMALRLVDSLVDRIASSRVRVGPSSVKTSREDGRADRCAT